MSEAASTDPWEMLRRLPMGREVEIRNHAGVVWRGTLVPSHELSGDRIVQLKLHTGYNVGIRIDPADEVRAVEASSISTNGRGERAARAAPERAGDEPWVGLLTTGGTIASRIDYRTGGVRPVKDEGEILAFYPDLGREGPVRIVPVFDRLSEEITPADWEVLAARVAEVFSEGAQGVVVAHGTDTLAYSAAALSFLLEDLRVRWSWWVPKGLPTGRPPMGHRTWRQLSDWHDIQRWPRWSS